MDPTLTLILLIIAALLLVLLLFQWLTTSKRLAATQSEYCRARESYDADRAEWERRRVAFEAEIARLAKWEGVADADAKATELITIAQETLEKASKDADALTLVSRQEADRLIADAHGQSVAETTAARQEARKTRDHAYAALESATVQAKGIIDSAEKRAVEIAGSAYEAMTKAALFEETVQAMKNLIEGYGDRYLIPERSLLDGLAEEYGHTEAGVELKTSRERSVAMVKAGTAATCDYVEPNRRTTAIRFVIDAFNGKVDSILSRVKHDNAGTLGQEIRDAFTLVNYNGKAFRDARVTEEYREARLAELKWASVAQQLRQDEKDEQRRIKDQIREEEKARKEYERAIREAARDEEVLRKAMEKAMHRVEQATEAQKVQYEQQLQDLRERLKEAEERSQRAISMAQQTKRGHVYIISNVGSFGSDVYKIGLTRRLEPLDRVRELGDSSVPFDFDVHAMIFAEDAPALETQLHKHFVLSQMNKVDHRKEFFRVDLKHIRAEIENLGIAPKWTLAAEAREYRETLAIEKAIKSDPAKREAWMRRQLELEPVDIAEQEDEVAVV